MDFAEAFAAVGDLATGAKARRRKEMDEFLTLHKKLVETVPTEVVTMFGNLPVEVNDKRGQPLVDWGIELSVTDHIFWRDQIEDGVAFKHPVASVKRAMLHHLTKQVEDTPLEPKERKVLLALVANG